VSGPEARPRAVIFDWDNTLVNSWHVIHEALNLTLSAFGLDPWTLEETKARVAKSMRDSFPALFGSRWEQAGEVFYEKFAAIHLDRIEPIANAGRMLADFQREGLFLGVVSNKKGEYLRREAEHLGWRGHFGNIIGALDAPEDKPAAAPVKMALEGSGVEPGQDVWFVGDNKIDLECAANAGCVPVLVREKFPQEGEFSAHPPRYYFHDCLALSKRVKSL